MFLAQSVEGCELVAVVEDVDVAVVADGHQSDRGALHLRRQDTRLSKSPAVTSAPAYLSNDALHVVGLCGDHLREEVLSVRALEHVRLSVEDRHEVVGVLNSATAISREWRGYTASDVMQRTWRGAHADVERACVGCTRTRLLLLERPHRRVVAAQKSSVQGPLLHKKNAIYKLTVLFYM